MNLSPANDRRTKEVVETTMQNPMHTRSRRVPVMLVAALFVAACAQPTRAPRTLPSPMTGFAAIQRSFDFRTVEVPAAKRTIAWGIDDHGEIVGSYDDS